MKHKWNLEYLVRTHGSCREVEEWRSVKRQELERKTGVKWVSWYAHGRLAFCPNWTKDTPELEYQAMAIRILEALQDHKMGLTFLALQEELPNVPLVTLIGVSKWLARRSPKIYPIQGRTGGACGIRIKK